MEQIFYYYNANPHKKIVRDCVYRALCAFFSEPWDEIAMRIVRFNLDKGLVNFTHITNITEFMKSEGYERHKPPRKGMTIGEFVREYAEKDKYYVIHCHRHLTFVTHDKVILDTWDCSDREMKYYWSRKTSKNTKKY